MEKKVRENQNKNHHGPLIVTTVLEPHGTLRSAVIEKESDSATVRMFRNNHRNSAKHHSGFSVYNNFSRFARVMH